MLMEEFAKMMINRRHQHAVGQGFFHTARLVENEDHRLRYVYDCGAMKKYAVPRDNRIDAYIRATGVGSLIDILFLSHVHYDHVSGVERLLTSGTGLSVDTIVLPLLHVADRLIAYARAANEEPGAAGDDFYRDLVADRNAALSRFGLRQIIFVRRGGPGGAPGSGGPEDPIDGDGDAPEIHGVRSKRGPAWKLVGFGQGTRVGPNDQASDGSSAIEIAVIDDTLAFASLAASSSGAPGSAAYAEWLLAPFVDPIVVAKRRKFIRTLARARSMTVSAMETSLEQVANVQDHRPRRYHDPRQQARVGACPDGRRSSQNGSSNFCSGMAHPT